MAQQILSIRLSADGLSFWTGDSAEAFDSADMSISRTDSECVSAEFPVPADGLAVSESIRDAVAAFRGILEARGINMPEAKILYGDTLSTVLIPEAVFKHEDTGSYLSMYGFDLSDGKYAVVSKPIRGTVAIMALWQEHTRSLGECLGHFMVVSPLQYNLCRVPAAEGDSVRIFASPLHCFITVSREGKTVYSEALPLASAADIVYYLDWLNGKFGSAKWPVTISGHRPEELTALVAKRFKGCVCG